MHPESFADCLVLFFFTGENASLEGGAAGRGCVQLHASPGANQCTAGPAAPVLCCAVVQGGCWL